MQTSMSDYLAQNIIDTRLVSGTPHVSLSTTVPAANGTGAVELVAGRQPIVYTRTGRVANNAEVNFGNTPAGDNGKLVKGWVVFDAASAGNALFGGPLASATTKVAGFEASDGADKLYIDANPFTNNEEVVPFGASLPAPLVHGTTYFVINSAGDELQLSATSGGAAINLTSDGDGILVGHGYKTVNTGDPLKILANQLPITL